MKTVEWTRSAVRDVSALRDYIAQDSSAYADRFAQKIFDAIENAATFPLMGREMPEADSDSIREIIFQRYRIIYRVGIDRILVLMVIYGGRDLSQLSPKPWETL